MRDPNASTDHMVGKWIPVTNRAPEVSFPFPAPAVMPGQEFQYGAAANYIEYDYTTMQPLSTCTVNYGDGAGDLPGEMAIYEAPSGLCGGPVHTYATAGTYTFSVTVTDPDGRSGTGSTQIQIVAPAAAAIVADIQLSYKAGKAGSYTYTPVVTITDGNRNPLNKALIDAEWTLPDGSVPAQQATTNRNGVATFRNQKDGAGDLYFRVNGVTKTGYTYVPGLLTYKHIVVP
jgi:hypothetical protein